MLVTDSSACLPPGLLSRTDLRVIPIAILIGDDEMADGPDVAATVYRSFDEEAPTKSAAPSLRHYLDAVESGEFDEALILTPAAEFTVMYRNARLAATMSHRHVEFVDTRTAAAGQGLVVSVAAEAVLSGASAAEAAELARRAALRTELVAMLPDLTSIERSGHVRNDGGATGPTALPLQRRIHRPAQRGRGPYRRRLGAAVDVAGLRRARGRTDALLPRRAPGRSRAFPPAARPQRSDRRIQPGHDRAHRNRLRGSGLDARRVTPP
jgi:hypothetical protein